MIAHKRQSGFTLAELMTVVVIVGVMAALASVSLTKGRASNQLDAFANTARTVLLTARNRAVATSSTYLVDIQPTSIQMCQIDPTLSPAQSTCPTVTIANCNGGNPPCQNSRVYLAGSDAIINGSNPSMDRTGQVPGALPGGHQPVYFFRDGTSDNQTGASQGQHRPIEAGTTIYMQGVTASVQLKHRKVIVYPASGRARVIDAW